MKISEMRDMNDNALRAELDKLAEEARNLRFQEAIGPLENPMRYRHIRREAARIQTVLSERVHSGGSK